ncbi:MAG: UDP-N-acetylmuramoyl-L-alanine--D-glutamate ligase [bacterium]
MKVLVVGLGISGVSSAKLLKRFGNKVSVYDDNKETLNKFKEYSLYDEREAYQMAVVSPGIPSNHAVVQKLRREGVEVIGEMELAGRYLNSETVIAVTGTNGKSTTVSLIHSFLKEAGCNSFLCGNIGEPVSNGVNKGYDFLVIEVSSFQLETLQSIHPDVAVILNVSPDHLDRYSSYEHYLLTKAELAKLVKPSGIVVLNGADETLIAACVTVKVRRKYFSAKGTDDISFRGGNIYVGNSELKIDNIPLKGLHNVENIMAAILAVEPYVDDINCIRQALEKFNPLPHRAEFVGKIGEVSFIDDSKGTNVGATEMSLSGFEDGEVVLILGGVDKGGSYEPLRVLAEKKCKGVVLIGEAKSEIKRYFEGFEGVVEASSMKEAVEKSFYLAQNKGVVLFSPACSSYDWYNNFIERGVDFRDKINELKRELAK